MGSRPFSNADPFLQLIVLFLMMFFCVGVFLLMAQGLLNALWGVNLFETPDLIYEYGNPEVVQINRVLLLFQHLGLFVIPAIVFAKLCSSSWKQFLGFRFILPQFLVGSAVLMIVALPFINVLAWLNEGLEFPMALKGLEEVFVSMEANAMELTEAIAMTESVGLLIFNLLVVAVLPAFGEEMIFRGLILPMIRRWTGNVHVAVWVTAFLFSAMHLQIFGFLPRLILGALLGYLFVWSRTLWAPIVAHLANNGLALILMFLIARDYIPEEADRFEGSSGDWIWMFASLLAMTFCILFLLKYARGWKNNRLADRWRQKGEE